MRYLWKDSPLGAILLAKDEAGLRVLAFAAGRRTTEKPRQPEPGWVRDPDGLRDESAQLDAYFAGELTDFEMRLAPRGTAFQRRVWEALLEVPYGTTTSYGALAARIGRPAASRAVGAANGANPIAIVIPCHRVIGADGSLTGYGGGIDNKRRLLGLEAGGAAGPGPQLGLGLG